MALVIADVVEDATRPRQSLRMNIRSDYELNISGTYEVI
jgi:hypothetical protein